MPPTSQGDATRNTAPVDRLNRSVTPLIGRARDALGFTQEELGKALGASKRTAHRWEGGQATPSVLEVRKLAGLVFRGDPTLAAELASCASTTLEELGLVPAQIPRPPPTSLVVQAVVCVAADELSAPPATVRRAVHAAFKCARELGLSLEDVEKALEPETPKERVGRSAR